MEKNIAYLDKHIVDIIYIRVVIRKQRHIKFE